MSSMIIASMFGLSILVTIVLCIYTQIWWVGKTLLSVYKNFIHWSVSKLMILGAMVWAFVIVCIPVVLLFLLLAWVSAMSIADIIGYFFGGNTGEANFFVAHGSWIYLLQVVELLLYLVVGFLFIYSRVLLHRLHISYTKWKQLTYMKNYYFDIKRMWLVVKYSCFSIVIAAVPVIIFAAILWAILFFSNGSASLAVAQSPLLQITLLFLFSIVAIMSAIIAFRLYFWLIAIADKKKITKKDTLKFYLSKSREYTQGYKKVMYALIPVLLFIGIIFLPKDYLHQYFQVSISDTQNYIVYSGVTLEQKQQILSSEEFGFYYNALEINYGWLSEDDIKQYFYTLYIFLVVYQIAVFFILAGLFEMLMLSIYTNLLKK